MNDEPGASRIGNWVVDRKLGEGGMGAVYACHHVIMAERVAAVKVMKTGAFPGGEARFIREIRLLTQLRHRAIVGVLDSGLDGDTLYVAMEMLSGEELAARIDRGPMPTADALAVFAEIAVGLNAAHAQGVFHRDLKPENVMLTPLGPKLIDFGIALPEGGTRYTSTSVVIGTPTYMPPEVFSEGAAAAPRAADIYALGQMLCEALRGERAFKVAEGLSASQANMRLMGMKVNSEALDPGPGFPESVRDLVRSATEPDPARRMPTLDPFLALQGHVAAPTVPVGAVPVGVPAGRPLARAAWVVGVVSAVAVLGCGGAAVLGVVAAGGAWSLSGGSAVSPGSPTAPGSPIAPGSSVVPSAAGGPALGVAAACGGMPLSTVVASTSIDAPAALSPGVLVGGHVSPGAPPTRNYWKIDVQPGGYRVVLEARRSDGTRSNLVANVDVYSAEGEKRQNLLNMNQIGYRARVVHDWHPGDSGSLILGIDPTYAMDYRLAVLPPGVPVPSPYFDDCPPVTELGLDAPVSADLVARDTQRCEAWFHVDLPPGTYQMKLTATRADHLVANVQADIGVYGPLADFNAARILPGINDISDQSRVVRPLALDGPSWVRVAAGIDAQHVEVVLSH